MAQFRKKPVVIEANRWDGDNARELQSWAHEGLGPMANAVIHHDGLNLYVRTLEGNMLANVGDMIIRGVKGEFYPCKPDIFDATYELVEPEYVEQFPPYPKYPPTHPDGSLKVTLPHRFTR